MCVCVCVSAVTKDGRVCEVTDTQEQVGTLAPKEGLRAKFKSCCKTVKCEATACAKAVAYEMKAFANTVKCEVKACAKAVVCEVKLCADTVKCEVRACVKATQCGAKACAVEVKRCLGAWLRIVL